MILHKLFKYSNQTEKYFSIVVVLLLVEGIFRKWILPDSIGNIFMIIRDPFVAYIVIKNRRLLNGNFIMQFIIFMAIILFFATLFVGHHNIFVALYGIRIWVIYFPAIYIFGKLLSQNYVERVGWLFVKILPFVIILTILQFISPVGAFVNKGLNTDIDITRSAGEAMLRPSGIFTSIAGLACYYTITFPFLLYFWTFRKDVIKRKFIIIAICLYIVSIPVSISRTHFLFSLANILFYMCIINSKKLNKILSLGVVILLSLFVMQKIPTTNVFIDTFLSRFEGASETEGGTANSAMQRTLGDALEILQNDIPTFGYGEGFCTNFGVKMITGVVGASNIHDTKLQKVYLDSEMEWSRIMTEDGIVLGVLMILLRLCLGLSFIKVAYSWKRKGYKIPWLFLGPPLIFVTTMPMKQPFSVGFMFIYGAIFIAYSQKKISNV